MSTDVAVCVVGAGRAGGVHASNFRWRVPRARLVAIVDTEEERARALARELDLDGHGALGSLEEALRRVPFDAVVITTPTFTHAQLTRLCAEAGKHVLCEKPMALTVEECDLMIEAAQRFGAVLQIGFMRRFDPAFREAKELIDEGRIGPPLLVRSLTRGPGLPPEWAWDPAKSNGMLAEVNSHDFDTVRWLTGAEFHTVHAWASALKAPEIRDRYPAFYDTAVVTAHLSTGALAMIDGVCPADYGYDARAEVVGSEGVLLIGEVCSMSVGAVHEGGDVVGRTFSSWRERFAQAYLAEAEHFVRCVLERLPPDVSGLDGRAAVEAARAANESIRSEASVTLPMGS